MKRILLLFAITFCFTMVSQAALRKTIACTAGQLSTLLGSDLATCSELIVIGTIDGRDFKTMRDSMPELVVIDLSDASILAYTGTEGCSSSASYNYATNVIPTYAFLNKVKLLSVKLPNTATKTGTGILSGCSSLKFIVFPASVDYIGLRSLSGCTSLGYVTLKNTTPYDYASEDVITNMMDNVDPTKVTLYVPQGTSAAYDVAKIWGNIPTIKEFKTINNTAGNLESLAGSTFTYIEIKGEINAVDFKTINYSKALIIDMSEANIVAYYGNEGCYSSFNVHYDANEVPPRAFQMNPATIQYVDLPKSAKELSFEVFNGCPYLKWVNIHDSVSTIGYSSFFDCPNLTYLFIPSAASGFTVFRNIQSVIADDNNPNYASSDSLLFTKDNTSLIHCSIKKTGSYTIPSGVKALGTHAFNSCKLLTSVTIPSTITKYGDAVFYNCTGLTRIKVGSSTPYVLTGLTNSFTNVNKTTCTLYVPAGSKALYQAADLWKDFVNIVEYTSTISLSAETFEVDTVANTQSVTITSNTYGVATSNQTWVSIQQPNYTGNSTLKFDISENPTASVRTATITITAEGTTSKQVAITQKAQVPALRVSASSLIVAAGGSTVSVDITSNTAWTATSSQTWLTINKKTGSGNFTLSCTVPAHTLLTSRTATITLTATGVANKVITVIQNGVPPSTSVVASGTSFAIKGGSINLTVTSNTTWTITKSHSWLSLNKTSGTGNATVICTAPYTNNIATELTFTLTISSPGLPNQTITLTQAAAAPTLSTSQTSINFSSAQSNKSLAVYSNTNWTVSSDQSWVTYSPSSGTSGLNLTCSVTENILTTSRTATITLSATGVDSKTITVTQDAAPVSLALSQTSLSFDAVGSTQSVNVTANAAWTVSSDQSWLTLSAVSGTNNGAFSCTAAENTTTASRTATVTLSATGAANKIITITQAATAVTIAVSTTSHDFSTSGGSASVDIASNAAWTATFDQSWLTLSAASGTGNGTFSCTADENTTTANRTATVTVSAGVESRTITISQSGASPAINISEASLNFEAAGSAKSIGITSNADWTMSSDQTWLTLGATSGTGNATVTCTASANAQTTSRTATITLSATGVTSKIITVTQDAAGVTLTVSKTSLDFTTSGGSATVDITSDGTWKVSSDQTWLTVSSASGTNNGVITITTTANTTQANRTATITIVSEGLADRTISITQAGDVQSGIDDLNSIEISVFPNPTQDVLYVTAENVTIEKVSVMNGVGATVMAATSFSKDGYINLSSLKSGVYFLKIQAGNKVWVKKIFKN